MSRPKCQNPAGLIPDQPGPYFLPPPALLRGRGWGRGLPGRSTFRSVQEGNLFLFRGQRRNETLVSAQLTQPRDLWSWSSVSSTFGGGGRCLEKVTWTRSEPPALPSVVGAGSGRRAADVLQGACPQLCLQATTPPSIVCD